MDVWSKMYLVQRPKKKGGGSKCVELILIRLILTLFGLIFRRIPVLHTHFPPYSFFPPEKWVYTSFSPGKISIYSFFPPERSVYTHLSPWFLGGEIWVYTEVSPSYSILPLCTDRLYKGNNSHKGSTLWRLL